MKSRIARRSIAVLVAGVCVLATRCDVSPGDGDSGGDARKGTLRVLITDKPFPYEFIEKAIVTISRVEVRGTVSADGEDCLQVACAEGACAETVSDCDDGDACTDDSCDADSGECLHQEVECDDGQACVEGECATSCTDDAECDDTDTCTTDTCVTGYCNHAAMDCDDGDPCTDDSCDTGTGECSHDDIECGDVMMCAEGQCATPCAEDAECEDGDACTTDSCAAGFCSNAANDCDDGDPCTDDSCAPDTGECINEDIECAEGEICVDGLCLLTCVEDADCTLAPAEDGADDADADGENDEDGEDDGESWFVIYEGEKEFDLLELQGGRTDLLAYAEIPAGTYTQMRLIVTGGEITLTDGRVFPLDVPSGAQTGIKLHFTFEVEGDEETVLLLDVDLSRAFKPIPGGRIDEVGGISSFKFSPSLAMRLIRLVDAGSIAGTVTDADANPLPDASVTAFADDQEVANTVSGEDGTYLLGGLPAGVCRLEFSASDFEDAELNDVSVTAGETTGGMDVAMNPTAP